MSQDDALETGLDFSAYVPRYFEPSGLVGHLCLVDVRQAGRTLRVVFDGTADIRPGRFGVHIVTPERVGDERWRELPVDADEPAEEWVKMAVILELMEVYDTTAQSIEVRPDEEGIIWLS